MSTLRQRNVCVPVCVGGCSGANLLLRRGASSRELQNRKQHTEMRVESGPSFSGCRATERMLCRRIHDCERMDVADISGSYQLMCVCVRLTVPPAVELSLQPLNDTLQTLVLLLLLLVFLLPLLRRQLQVHTHCVLDGFGSGRRNRRRLLSSHTHTQICHH